MCIRDRDTVTIRNQGVFQPMQRLHDAHSRTPGPVETARCGLFEVDRQLVELDGATTGIGMDLSLIHI